MAGHFLIIDGNPDRPELAELLSQIAKWAEGHTLPLRVPKSWTSIAEAASSDIKPFETVHEVITENIDGDAGLVICMGGDGSLLHAARAYGSYGLPILGINLGSVGFNSKFDPHNYEHELDNWIAGKSTTERRCMIQIRHMRAAECVRSSLALNELALLREPRAHMLELELRSGDELISNCFADGIVVATPTGSTAYNASAGGPIVHPALDALVVSLLEPHTLSERPIVLPGTMPLKLQWESRGADSQPVAILDGQEHWDTAAGDCIEIELASEPLTLIDSEDHSENGYFHTLREKMRWNVPIREPGRRT